MILCIKIDDICYVYRYQRQTYKQLQGKIAGLMAEYEAVPPPHHHQQLSEEDWAPVCAVSASLTGTFLSAVISKVVRHTPTYPGAACSDSSCDI
jgi:hypothetical protein